MVSVIIPFYNRINYVKRAVESVINQSYFDWEIILIDDCSLDKLDIQYEFSIDHLSKIKLITNKQNLGPGLSRQAGLDVAIGEYVCFLDSDDFYHLDFLLKTMQGLLLAPKTVGAYCITVSTNGRVNRWSDHPANSIMPDLFIRNRPWETSSWLWRKAEIAVWTNLRTNEDWLFELDTAIKNNNIIHIPESLCIKDDDTGENTKDLINNKLPEIHRNIVARCAVKRLRIFSSYSNYRSIRKAVIRRLIFTSSRLIYLKEERKVAGNSLLLIRYHLPLAAFLLFLSLTTFKSVVIATFYKKVLNRLSKTV
jgi:glycosyltransferase involved in cell wall biosynthesis